ncbi:MAG: tandem-95 repeat protein, partial [Gallionella sp.]|nr:tandem-95 repeat protein [Gallionella sp.]
AAGALTYTPVADFNGTDSFTYTVTSPAGVTETATVNVTVTPVVDIANDVANTLEDTAVITNVLGNDSFEGSTTISAVTQGAHGAVTVNGDKTITYTSVADFNGLDSYTYSVTSGGITETATVNVTVTPVADIVTDAVTTAEDTAITFNAITGVGGVGNADNFEGTPVLTSVTQGLHGAVTFTGAGAVTYTPVADFNGSDSVTYTVTSPAGVTETATINVTVTPVGNIANDVANTFEDTAVTTSVLGNDNFSGTTSISAVTQGTHGTVTVNGDKTITYTPVADFNGLDSYTYSVTSGGITETATVNVTVSPVVDITTDAVTTAEDAAITFNAITGVGGVGSADNFEGTPVLTSVTQGLHGAITFNGTGAVTYTPVADFNGADSFTYTVTSPAGVTETATVNVTVTPVVDIANDVANTLEDTAVITNVLGNDSFAGTTSISAVTQGTHGTVTVNGDKTITYTPVADFNGLDSYTYSVTTGGVTETANVNVTVTPVADIVTDAVTTTEDTAITFNAITAAGGAGGADNFEGSPVLTSVTQGTNGAVTFTAAGALTYTPVADFNGTDSFTYTVTSPAG